MASNINIAIPPLGTPTTSGVRANFGYAKLEIEALQGMIGFVDYNDAATTGSPISVSSSTWTVLTNDKSGAYTKTDYLPADVTNLWNTSTNRYVFTELPVNTMLDVRADIVVTTSTANQVVKLRNRFAIGHASEFSLESSEWHFKSSGAKNIAHATGFYIGSSAVQANPGAIEIWSDNTCTVKVNGWYIRIIKAL